MQSRIISLLVFALLSISCKKETAKQTVSTVNPTIEKSNSTQPKTECYTYDSNGSLIELRLQYDGDAVSGTLNYAIAEKDSNMGTFKGTLENNILIADYTFQSEGTQSSRQIAFELKDGKMVEGYGDMVLDGTRFKDINQIKFTSTMPLSRVNCVN